MLQTIMNGRSHIYNPGSKRFLTRPSAKSPRQLFADPPDMLDEPSLSPHRVRLTRLLVFALCLLPACSFAYNVEDYEESGGISFSVRGNRQQGVYGFAFEEGTWLAGTPVFGQFFLNVIRHDQLDATFGGVGMIFKIMPHWQVAPYAGGGASYNNRFNGNSGETRDTSDTKSTVESHWAWHAEGGLRVWLPGKIHFFEFFGRQTWTAMNNDYNYGTAGFGYGQNF